MKKIILGSASPRRKQLLELARISFEVRAPDIEETFDHQLIPSEIAIQLATIKANAIKELVCSNDDDYTIIGADTIVECNGTILAKPLDAAGAFEMLTLLSGKTHNVITGVCLLSNNKRKTFFVNTAVTFLELTREQKEFYINQDKPFDKAGGYAIQEWIGAVGIEKINGDYYNVMGLPLSRLVKELKDFNL